MAIGSGNTDVDDNDDDDGNAGKPEKPEITDEQKTFRNLQIGSRKVGAVQAQLLKLKMGCRVTMKSRPIVKAVKDRHVVREGLRK